MNKKISTLLEFQKNNDICFMTLSEYLHGHLATLVDRHTCCEAKVKTLDEIIDFMNSSKSKRTFEKLNFYNGDQETQKGFRDNQGYYSCHDELHSSIIADRYITLYPVVRNSNYISGEHTSSISFESGIQLPSIKNWNDHFTKGYSLLMWIRFHGPYRKTQNFMPPAVLFRIASSESSIARGIEATLHPVDYSESCSSFRATINVRLLNPQLSNISQLHSTSLLIPITFPLHSWCLLSIQHSYPYVTRPILAVALNGTEWGRDELAYPSLSHGESSKSDLFCHFLLLSNLTLGVDVASMGLYHPHRKIDASGTDLHRLGFYTDFIPNVLQAIIAEHGPEFSTVGGVLPLVPSVSQSREAIVPMINNNSGRRCGKTGRGLGIPLTVGVSLCHYIDIHLLSSFGSLSSSWGKEGTGHLIIQRLLSNLVMGFHASDAFLQTEREVVILVKTQCTVGNMANIPIVGLVQPHSSLGQTRSYSGDRSNDFYGLAGENNMRLAKCIGNSSLEHVTLSYLNRFVKNESNMNRVSPSYQLPTKKVDIGYIPSFLSTYHSINPISLLLLPFHLALPPTAYKNNLQVEYYHQSFVFLWELIQNDGALAGRCIDLFASTLKLGGRMRDETLQCGAIHILANLLRRILLRAERLNMLIRRNSGREKHVPVDNVSFSNCGIDGNNSRKKLWQYLAPRESPDDDLADINSYIKSAPSYVPEAIVCASHVLINACCGVCTNSATKFCSSIHNGMEPMTLYIRRTSDVALTALFGYAMDFDLWGGDVSAAAYIMKECIDRYCIDELNQSLLSLSDESSIITNHIGYGRLMRDQITVQYLLDMIRLRFGRDIAIIINDVDRSWEYTSGTKKIEAQISLANSLSRLLYTLLKYSLSIGRCSSQGEDDIMSSVAVLSDCPLGSIGAHVVLTALKDLLVYCEAVRVFNTFPSFLDDRIYIDMPPDLDIVHTFMSIYNFNLLRDKNSSLTKIFPSSLNSNMSENEEQIQKLKLTKTRILSRLGRNLLMGHFHDVLAPMLLSRTVFDGRRVMMKNENAFKVNKAYCDGENATGSFILESKIGKINDPQTAPLKCIGWQDHWKISLLIFTWLTSVAGTEGDNAAKSVGNLLYHSGFSGSLNGCFTDLRSTGYNNSFFLALILPPQINSTSAISPRIGSSVAKSTFSIYQNDLSHRIRIVTYVMGGLIASLLSDINLRDNIEDRTTALTKSTVNIISAFISTVIATFRLLYFRTNVFNVHNISIFREVSLLDQKAKPVTLEVLKEAIPPFLMTIYLIAGSIHDLHLSLTHSYDDDINSIDNIENITMSSPTKIFCTAPFNLVETLNGDTDQEKNSKFWTGIGDNDLLHITSFNSDICKSKKQNVDLPKSQNKNEISFDDTTSHDLELESPNFNSIKSCIQKMRRNCDMLLHTTGTLILHAIHDGEREMSTVIWGIVFNTLTSFSHPNMKINTKYNIKISANSNGHCTAKMMNRVDSLSYINERIQSIICHLSEVVLMGILVSDKWSTNVNLCSAISDLCNFVNEKELLQVCISSDVENSSKAIKGQKLTVEQVRLLCVLLDVMRFGREKNGWCQDDQPLFVAENQTCLQPSNAENVMLMSEDNLELAIPLPVRNRLYKSYSNQNCCMQFLDSTSISKMLLSILELLFCLASNSLSVIGSRVMANNLPSDITTSYTKHSCKRDILMQEENSLLSQIIEELRQTLKEAIIGLPYHHSKYLCLKSLSCVRKAIFSHQVLQDIEAEKMCLSLIIAIVEVMRERYMKERLKDEVLNMNIYNSVYERKAVSNSGTNNMKNLSFPNLMISGSITNRRKPDFCENNDANSHDIKYPLIANSLHNYKAFFSTQRGQTYILSHNINKFRLISMLYEDENDNFISFLQENEGCKTLNWIINKYFKSTLFDRLLNVVEWNEKIENKHRSDVIMTHLNAFLNTWDEHETQSQGDSQLFMFYDKNLSFSKKSCDEPLISKITETISRADTAADSMSSYIELALVENSRLAEIINSHLPSRRKTSIAFAERHCWKVFFELFSDDTDYGMAIFERCMTDGGRCYGERCITVPIGPQFGRSIPEQYDRFPCSNSSGNDKTELEDKYPLNVSDHMGEIKHLVRKGSLIIVDITKRQKIDKNKSSGGSVDAVLLNTLNETEDDYVQESSERNQEIIELKEQIEYSQIFENGRVDVIDELQGVNQYVDECRLNKINSFSSSSSESVLYLEKLDDGEIQHTFTLPSFAKPPDSSFFILSRSNDRVSACSGHGSVELYFDNIIHVKAEGSRLGTLLFTATHLIFEYSDANGLFEGEILALEETKNRYVEGYYTSYRSSQSYDTIYEKIARQQKKVAGLRPKMVRWNISELSHIYLRRYRLRDSALEMFFVSSGGSVTGGTGLSCGLTSLFLDFGSGSGGNMKRDNAAKYIIKRAPEHAIKQRPEKSGHFIQEQSSLLTDGWIKGRLSNFEYLLSLNFLAGRSFNDLCQYPIMPWVLSNYTSEEIPDLKVKSNYRDLSMPMGALNPDRLKEFVERFETFQDPTIPPFMYGSHYSTSAGVVLHYLVRLHPFASLHRQLQGGHFDVADRLFSSVPRSWDMCTGSSTGEVKELTPEWYCNPSFLLNSNNFKLGTSQDGEELGDVVLPPWAKGNPEKFVEILRCALESDICTSMLPNWIDLIFGIKQQGPESVKACNVFFYLTYYGSVDVSNIKDKALRTATELQIAHFGQCPMQLFRTVHINKYPKQSPSRRLLLTEMLNLFDLDEENLQPKKRIKDGENSGKLASIFQLPFQSAPISHWVHVFAPPPGPHAPIIAVRLAGNDRCLAIDALGIFHSFRWEWRTKLSSEKNPIEESDAGNEEDGGKIDLFSDKGFFIAQRELLHFRSVPCLFYSPKTINDGNWSNQCDFPVVAISRSLYASGSLLLVLSDGDGKGSCCIQFVFPVSGVVKSHVFIPSVHSRRITAIHMDPIGIAADVGGLGGELAVVASEDGTASVWRFYSSKYLPLRPRLRIGGHGGSRIHAAVISSSLNICVTVSDIRCCIFSLGNGMIIRSFTPPVYFLESCKVQEICNSHLKHFAKTNALCVSALGYIVLVCTTRNDMDIILSAVETLSLELFSLEGVHLGTKVLESLQNLPNKISVTADGHAIMVCSNGGISIRRLSAIAPLDIVDVWHTTEVDNFETDIISSTFDVDFGPNLSSPVVTVAGCSSGALRLHALKGITNWNEENKKRPITIAVGKAFSKPSERLKTIVGSVKGTGSKIVEIGRDFGREAISDVKGRGVSSILGGIVGFRKK